MESGPGGIPPRMEPNPKNQAYRVWAESQSPKLANPWIRSCLLSAWAARMETQERLQGEL